MISDPKGNVESPQLNEAVAADIGPTRPGRKRDHARDADILDAAFDVLAEEGYEGMTMDMVAVRAKAGKATVYRRWASKAELVLDAVVRMKRSQVDINRLPDTGHLRGDLLALFKPPSIKEGEHRTKDDGRLASMLSQHPKPREAGNAAIVKPRGDGASGPYAASSGSRRNTRNGRYRYGLAGYPVDGGLPGTNSAQAL